MNDTLKALSLGVVNLLGVAVPGFLILFIAGTSLLLPILAISLHVENPHWNEVTRLLESNRSILVGLVLVLSYVAGYILRLTTPDKLDRISADHVLKQIGSDEAALWPTKCEKGDKFPYYYFKDYLEARSLDRLLKHVNWGRDDDEDSVKRSKTAVHQMKLDIVLGNPELSGIVDSNEAHIRLMAGTWLAIRITFPLVILGSIVALFGLALVHSSTLRSGLGLPETHFLTNEAPPYAVFLSINIFIALAAQWARVQIESLFHYRRVGELVFITMAADVAREKLSRESGLTRQ